MCDYATVATLSFVSGGLLGILVAGLVTAFGVWPR